jgi:hypothetical protein
MRKTRRAVAEYQAAVILVAITLALASVAYSALRRQVLEPEGVFSNSLVQLGGTPPLVRLAVNSSESVSLTSFSADEASSANGVLFIDSAGYHTMGGSLCVGGGTSFFSVLTTQSGNLQVTSNGQSWISGAWTSSEQEAPGWHEVMIDGATSCSITLPGGQVVTGPGFPTNSIPVEGALNGTSFVLYVPTDSLQHVFLLTSDGGLDTVGV